MGMTLISVFNDESIRSVFGAVIAQTFVHSGWPICPARVDDKYVPNCTYDFDETNSLVVRTTQ